MKPAPFLRLLVTLPLLLACAAAASRPAGPTPSPAPSPASDARPNGRGGTSTVVIPVVPLEQPFRLALDHLVRVADTGVRLRFTKVLEDSRCPRGASCFWAGRMRAQLEVTPAAGHAQSIELATDGDPTKTGAAGLRFELQGVEPEARIAGQQPRPDEYALTLVVRRKP